VAGINDAPVAVDDAYSISFNLPQNLSVLSNDFDLDTPINVGSVEIGQLPGFGSSTPLPSGQIRYVPNPGFVGTDTFTYRVRDALGKPSNEALVTITVNTAPVANADSARTSRDVPIFIDVLANDSDLNGSLVPSSVTVVTPPQAGSAVAQSNGTILYSPPAGFSGITTFQYVVSDNDGLQSNVATVTVNVVASLFQNPINRYDVNADTFVSPIDVLVLVNLLNSRGPSIPVDQLPGPPDYVDVNADGFASPLDVIEVINFINAQGSGGAGEGEGEGASGILVGIQSAPLSEWVLAAMDRNASILKADALLNLFVEEETSYGPVLPSKEAPDVHRSLDSFLSSIAVRVKHPKATAGALDDLFAEEDWESL
jgi:hypothetical protein